jgi:hypothetical protein
MSRAFLNAFKNPLAYWIRVFMYVALAILMGTTWVRMDMDQSTVQDRMAALFFATAFLSFMAVAGKFFFCKYDIQIKNIYRYSSIFGRETRFHEGMC